MSVDVDVDVDVVGRDAVFLHKCVCVCVESYNPARAGDFPCLLWTGQDGLACISECEWHAECAGSVQSARGHSPAYVSIITWH